MINKKILLSILGALFGILTTNGQIECDYSVIVENEAVHRYMQEINYEPHDSSVIEKYKEGTTYRKDWPNPVVMNLPETNVDSVTIICYDAETLKDTLKFHVSTANTTVDLYNFIPRRKYQYEILNGEEVLQYGKIRTKGQVRMIKVPGTVYNIRDMGGWKTADNMQIKYGKIFRGSELNGNHIATAEGIQLLRELGVEAELDLRAWYNTDHNVSAFGFKDTSSTPSGEVPTFYYSNDSGQLPEHMNNYTWLYKWRYEFNFIVNNLKKERAIYQHCVYGKDRTGFLSFLLEGLLGVPYNELVKDYELTFFSNSSESTKDSIDKVFDYIETMEGETLRDKFNTFFTKKIVVSQDNIDYFRSEMLESLREEEEDITTNIERLDNNQSTKDCRIVFDIMGRKVDTVRKNHIYLVRDDKGSIRKVIIP